MTFRAIRANGGRERTAAGFTNLRQCEGASYGFLNYETLLRGTNEGLNSSPTVTGQVQTTLSARRMNCGVIHPDFGLRFPLADGTSATVPYVEGAFSGRV